MKYIDIDGHTLDLVIKYITQTDWSDCINQLP